MAPNYPDLAQVRRYEHVELYNQTMSASIGRRVELLRSDKGRE